MNRSSGAYEQPFSYRVPVSFAEAERLYVFHQEKGAAAATQFYREHLHRRLAQDASAIRASIHAEALADPQSWED